MPEIQEKGGFSVAKSVDSMIGDLVGTLTDSIIVYPGGWGDSLPPYTGAFTTLAILPRDGGHFPPTGWPFSSVTPANLLRNTHVCLNMLESCR